jgi:choline dehydrogenase-like flavoprotein
MVTLRFAGAAAARADPDTPRLVLVHSVGDRNNLMLFPRQTSDGLVIMVTLRLPSSSGALRLRSADPATPPSIAYGYLAPADLRKLREGLEVAMDLACRAGATAVSDTADDWILSRLETADHACGTCKLGSASDSLAVVDDMCRVHGVDGLHVVDLSIVPAPVRAGPYPTVVMLAERFAQLMSRGG